METGFCRINASYYAISSVSESPFTMMTLAFSDWVFLLYIFEKYKAIALSSGLGDY